MSYVPSLSPAQRFFYDHAGYSYDTAFETPEEGHRRSAAELAAAEIHANLHDWTVHFDSDEDEPGTYEVWLVAPGRDGEYDIIASVGAVDSLDAEYLRVLRAELAQSVVPAPEKV